MKTRRYVLYAGAAAAVLVAALLVGLGLRDRNVQVAATPSPIAATSTPIPASSAPAATTSPVASAAATPTLAPTVDVCGSLVAFAGGGGDPRYLLTISSGGTATRYRLSGSGTAPSDVGDLFAAKTPQLLTIAGRQITPNSADPQAINLTDFTVTRVTACARP